MTTITNLELVGGHPLIDFVNTEVANQGTQMDLFVTNSDYILWLSHVGLLSTQHKHDTPSIDLLPLLRHTRQQFRTLLHAMATERPLPEKTLEAINQLLAYRDGRTQLIREKNGRFTRTFTYAFSSTESYLAPLADAAAEFLTTADFRRVKQCGNHKCIRYFLDTSRNRSRRWCSMDGCGNRMKARTFYERHYKL